MATTMHRPTILTEEHRPRSARSAFVALLSHGTTTLRLSTPFPTRLATATMTTSSRSPATLHPRIITLVTSAAVATPLKALLLLSSEVPAPLPPSSTADPALPRFSFLLLAPRATRPAGAEVDLKTADLLIVTALASLVGPTPAGSTRLARPPRSTRSQPTAEIASLTPRRPPLLNL